MAKDWAIAVGINKYSNLTTLEYAKRDAEVVKELLLSEAGFDRVFLFTDDSPEIPTKPSPICTQPTFGHLRRFLRAQFSRKILKQGDNLWFFFAGHGMREANRDYLMLSDSDPGDVEHTAIPVHYITEQLRGSGADNVVLFLDACRNVGARGEGIGEEHRGVVTFYSCAPNQKSYEIEALQHGAFTYALIEALQGAGNCATVKRLVQYLRRRVPEINHQYPQNQGRQTPYTSLEPASKLHLILLPKYATLDDLATLKIEAYRAEQAKDYETARQLWIQVNIAADGSDMDAIEAIGRFRTWEVQPSSPPPRQRQPAPSQPESKPEVELKSAKGVDYTQLQKLLAAGKWKEADKETADKMLEVANREEQGWLDVEDIDNFPCEDLRTIDQLWVYYSNGCFGFSVQKEIYIGLGGTREYSEKVWENFGGQVGWQKRGQWLYYSDLTYELRDTTPKGHLPIMFQVRFSLRLRYGALFSRVQTCRL
ncbi:MAG: GUN4 domain-containing protein [Xenococcaceae cyanobacterium MO_234.B1]|nr:GUN4 domain-containing protein [Xenococcaceae cyanobacterium MO_234.B1]